MGFIAKYWKGGYSLAISFWLFFLAVSAIYHLLEPVIQGLFVNRPEIFVGVSVGYLVIFRLVVFPWQVIGLLRSSDRHYWVHNQAFISYGIQAVIVASLALTLAHIVGTAQSLAIFKEKVDFSAKRSRTDFSLELSDNGRFLTLNGSLDFGVTKAVRQAVRDHRNLQGVLLNSNGGQVYEGRGLAILFDAEGLDTYSFGRCSSACSTAFIGGRKRYLGVNAQLGFHQYTLDSAKIQQFHKFYDLDKEQQKDLKIFRAKNIKEEFLRKVFQTPHDKMWFPDADALLEAGVIDAIVAEIED